jgi:hypothetical protein
VSTERPALHASHSHFIERSTLPAKLGVAPSTPAWPARSFSICKRVAAGADDARRCAVDMPDLDLLAGELGHERLGRFRVAARAMMFAPRRERVAVLTRR